MSPAVDTGWSSPVPGEPVVGRPFEAPAATWTAGHRGVDLAASAEAAVLAPADGVVTFAGTVVDRGVLTITHPDGLRSSLEPVTATVTVGTRVGRGVAVGTLQDVPTHCAPAVCVHWGVRDGTTYLDPMHLLTGGPIVLLPWDDGAG
ncbi:M23 family metallopeptidase [Cellulomonas hominis]